MTRKVIQERKLQRKLKKKDLVVLDQTQIRRNKKRNLDQVEDRPAKRTTKYLESTPNEEIGSNHFISQELHVSKVCYICKKKFSKVHFFYDQLCPFCATLNYRKRLQIGDLKDRIALVTGGRVKIGFSLMFVTFSPNVRLECALKLLRCGAFVIITTRFPLNAAVRYSKELDFEEWKSRLHIYGLDLRDIPSVEKFCGYVASTYKQLDIIINNAAQTIRRPAAFYYHLIPLECQPIQDLPSKCQLLLQHSKAWNSTIKAHFQQMLTMIQKDSSIAPNNKQIEKGMEIAPSALMSIMPLAMEDKEYDSTIFPRNQLDIHGQQVDLRTSNSWSSTIEQVSTTELMEVHAVNCISPFIINSKLQPLLLKSKANDKYIINVSSMEGKFNRPHKDARHPHTNMAKAALNMMTLTIAGGYARKGIYVNSVDTGWVSDEHPREKLKQNNFLPPLDELDGAARVLDPIFKGLNSQVYEYGLFFKDYYTSFW